MNFRNIARCLAIASSSSILLGCSGIDNPFNISDTARKTNYLAQTLHRTHKAQTGSRAVLKKTSAPKLTQTPDPNSTGNLWERLVDGFQLSHEKNNAEIQTQIAWFTQHQAYLNRTTQHAAPYIYLVFDQVQQRNLPTELVLLPIIESDYYPLAYSGAGASGLWQLMPGTASKLGLKRNYYYDGRRDIFASTNAALDYLTYLQNYFNGDWLLAIAAYDAGEGTVQEAIRRNTHLGKSTDFWSLDLPKETKAYVPRILALATIISHRGAYSVKLPPINDQPYLGQVDTGAQLKLKDVAKLAGISLGEIRELNPAYGRLTTEPHGIHKLLLPIEKIADFKQRLAELPSQIHVNWSRYRVQHGDTLQTIATRFHTSLDKIKEANNTNSNRVKPGKIILVPKTSPEQQDNNSLNNLSLHQIIEKNTSEDIADLPQNNQQTDAVAVITKNTTHIVKFGDTLGSIAKHYHVTIKQLRQWNHLPTKHILKLGEQLAVTHSGMNSSNSAVKFSQKNTQKTHYIIRSGDTLEHIGKRYGVSIADLKRWNNLNNAKNLYPGQSIILIKG